MNEKKTVFLGIVGLLLVCSILAVACLVSSQSKKKDMSTKSLSELLERVTTKESQPRKGSISLDNNLFDELPEIDKYPTSVNGNGDIVLEIFSSGEKAGTGQDSWLIDVATEFNKAGVTTSDGQTVGLTVRSVSSGLASDYIASGKYLPDLYTPSNELFGEYCKIRGGDLEMVNPRLVGNTACLLVKKGSSEDNVKKLIDDVIAGKTNLGYTNPQTSATGLNLLIEILKTYDSNDMFSDTSVKAFSDFNNNIPFVAYTTQQMVTSAGNGSLDAIVSEYQAYINDENLKSMYDVVPFGVRHDNPLYVVQKSTKTPQQLEAIELVNTFLMSEASQAVATQKGFNANDDYKSDYETNGAEIDRALVTYKDNKDSGKDIIAVFVADCSGSMDGEPMLALKQSLTNGAQYINNNNQIGLVSYSDDVTIELPIAKFDLNQRSYFQGAVEDLSVGGGTASYDAILVAMNMIEKAKETTPDAKVMIFLLSDGASNSGYKLDSITPILKKYKYPVYTISYGEEGDSDALQKLSDVNEAASINSDSDDIIYKIKSLFNSQL